MFKFKEYWYRYILFGIFLLALALRLYFVFQNPNVDYDSYFELRQIEHIRSTGLPLIHDELSFSGRTVIATPLYYYFLAFFELFMPAVLVEKLIPSLLLSLMPILAYLISFHLTKQKSISLLASFISVFVPVFFASSIFTLSAQPIAILLMLVAIYCLMRLNDSEKYVNLFLIIVILLPLLHSSALLLVVGLLLYLFLAKIEGYALSKSELEIILFSTFFMAWTLFIVFKKAILMHGPSIILQSTPTLLLGTGFTAVDILKYVYYIGIIPLVFGVWSVFRCVFREKALDSYKLISFILSIFLLFALKLLDLSLALSCIGLVLVMLSGKIFMYISEYAEKTKAPNIKKVIFLAIIIIFLLTSLISTISLADAKEKSLPSDDEITVFRWLKFAADDGFPILASVKYGHILNFMSQKKDVFDNYFLYVQDARQIISDVKRIYQTDFEVEAVGLINKYRIKYIFLTPQEKVDYDIAGISYIDDQACFEKIYDKNNIILYKFLDCTTAQ